MVVLLFCLDGKFSSFSKSNIRLTRQSNFELNPSRTISSTQYDRILASPTDYPFYTLKVHFKRGSIQDYVMTSIPMVNLSNSPSNSNHSLQCLILQTSFQYSVNLFVNENGYLVGAQISTGNSTCNLSEDRAKQAEFNYKVAMRLQLNEAGPQ